MKKTLFAIALGCAALGVGAEPAGMSGPGPGPGDRAGRHVQEMKEHLHLTDAQSASMKSEEERFRGQMHALREEHRANMKKILTPEQQKLLDQRMQARHGHDDDGDEAGEHREGDEHKDAGGKK